MEYVLEATASQNLKYWAMGLLMSLVLIDPVMALDYTCESPNQQVKAEIHVEESGIQYALTLDGKTLLREKRMRLKVDGLDLTSGIQVGRGEYAEGNTRYVRLGLKEGWNNYRQLRLPITHIESGRAYILTFRIYNEGLATRYSLPGKGEHQWQTEQIEFTLAPQTRLWYKEEGAVTTYHQLARVGDRADLSSKLPVLMQLPQGIYLAALTEEKPPYPSLVFRDKGAGTVELASTYFPKTYHGKLETPWRIFVLGKNLDELYQQDMLYKLSLDEKPTLPSTIWVQGGKALQLETGDYDRQILSAKELGFEYVLFPKDADHVYQGPEYWEALGKVRSLSKEQGMKVWVWKAPAGLNPLSKRMQFFMQLKQKGVAGVSVEDDLATADDWRSALLRDAGRLGLMLNFGQHPLSSSEQWPHSLGCTVAWKTLHEYLSPEEVVAQHTLLPFTLGLNGQGDFACACLEPAVLLKSGTTIAHQLANKFISATPFSIWEGSVGNYDRLPTAEFISEIPTAWDETRVLAESELGQQLFVARRKGEDWFLAGINGEQTAKDIRLGLDFLGPSYYQATMLQDDTALAPLARRSEQVLSKALPFSISLQPGGGVLIRFRKIKHPNQRIRANIEGGRWKRGLKVELRGAQEIFYTLDGTEPRPDTAIRYQSAITLEEPCVLKAASFDEDGTRLTYEALSFTE